MPVFALPGILSDICLSNQMHYIKAMHRDVGLMSMTGKSMKFAFAWLIVQQISQHCPSFLIKFKTFFFFSTYFPTFVTFFISSSANAPHLSRVIPARSWAGAVPTLLTHEALDTLCRPSAITSQHPQKETLGLELSPLERFLGCVSMRRNLQRLIQSDESVSLFTLNILKMNLSLK